MKALPVAADLPLPVIRVTADPHRGVLGVQNPSFAVPSLVVIQVAGGPSGSGNTALGGAGEPPYTLLDWSLPTYRMRYSVRYATERGSQLVMQTPDPVEEEPAVPVEEPVEEPDETPDEDDELAETDAE